MWLDIGKGIFTILVGSALGFVIASKIYAIGNIPIEDEEEQEEDEIYEEKYLLDGEDNEDYSQQKIPDQSVEDETPAGKVWLKYNDDEKRFEYRSNHVIPYRYLEVVVRKYVLTYKCKELYIDCKQEYEQANNQQEKPEVKENPEVKEPDCVFVEFKSYNKQDSKIKRVNMAIKEQILPLKCLGKIEEIKTNNQIEKKDIGFADFKNKVSN